MLLAFPGNTILAVLRPYSSHVTAAVMVSPWKKAAVTTSVPISASVRCCELIFGTHASSGGGER